MGLPIVIGDVLLALSPQHMCLAMHEFIAKRIHQMAYRSVVLSLGFSLE